MDNYLSHRWPAHADERPLPMPPKTGKPRRDVLRAVLLVMGILALIALLVLIGFLVIRLILLVQIASSPRPAPSAAAPAYNSQQPSGWTPEDLPWADPDPAVRLALDTSEGTAMNASSIYERVLPGVVSVTAALRGGYSTGTGFIVESSGYVLTNYHIIDEGTALEVMLLSDSSIHPARVVGFDEEFDLAVLKIDGSGLPVLPLGDSGALSVGEQVYAVGNPMGDLYGSMTEGIVSALDREGNDIPNSLGMIQTSAALNSGNSGGPLLNSRGQVVGIVSAKITGMQNDTVIEGLGLAIPTTDLLPFVNHILATGESWRPSIGIKCVVASADGRTGIEVREVTADAAYQAGLRVGDLIVAANGTETPTLPALRRILYAAGVDGDVTCTVLRGGEELEIALTLIDTLGQESTP